MQITTAADRLATTLETKRTRRAWNPDLHPRDSKGRFIETGGIARLWGGGMARVLRALGGRNVLVENVSNRQRSTVHASRLTMVARPDGTAPTRSKRKVRDEDERRLVDARRGTGTDADDPGDEGDTPDEPHDKDDDGEDIGDDKEGEDLGEGPEPEDDDPLLHRGRVMPNEKNDDGSPLDSNEDSNRPTTHHPNLLPIEGGRRAEHVAGRGNALRARGPKNTEKDPNRERKFQDTEHARASVAELAHDYFADLEAVMPRGWDNAEAGDAYGELRALSGDGLELGEMINGDIPMETDKPRGRYDSDDLSTLRDLAEEAERLAELAETDGQEEVARYAQNLAGALELAINRFEAHGDKKIPKVRKKPKPTPRAWTDEPLPAPKGAAARPRAAKKTTAPVRRKDPNRRFKTLADVQGHWASSNLTPYTSDQDAQKRHAAATAELFDKLQTPQLSRNGHFVIGQMGVQRRNGETHYGWGVILTDSGVRLTLSPRKAEAADFVKRLETAQLDGKPFDWSANDYQSRLNTPEGQDMVRAAAAAARDAFDAKAAKKRAGVAARTTPAPATPQQVAQQITDRTGVPAANVAVGHVGSESFGDDRGRPRNDAELRAYWKHGGDETTPASQRDSMRDLANHPDITLHLANHRGFVIMEDRRQDRTAYQVRAVGTARPISGLGDGQTYGVFEDRDTADRFASALGSELRDQTGRTVDWGAPRLNRDLNAFRDKDNRPFNESVREVAGRFDRDRGRTDSEAAKYVEGLEAQRREQASQSSGNENSTSPEPAPGPAGGAADGEDGGPEEGQPAASQGADLSAISRAELDTAYKKAVRDQADGEYDDDSDKAAAASAEADAILAEAEKRDREEHADVLDRVKLGSVNDRGDRPVAIDGDSERMATLTGATGHWKWNRLGHNTRYSSDRTFLTREAALADLVRERDEEHANAPSPDIEKPGDTGRQADDNPPGQNAEATTAEALEMASQKLIPVLNSIRAKHGNDVATELAERAHGVVGEHEEGELSSSEAIAAFQSVLDDVQRATRGLEGRDNMYVQDLLRLARENVGVARAALADQRKRDKDRGVRGSGANVLENVPAGRGGADGQHRAGGVRAGEVGGDSGGDSRPGRRPGADDEGRDAPARAGRAAQAGPVRSESIGAAGSRVRDGEGAGDGDEGHASRVPASPGRVTFGSPEQEAVAPSYEPPANGETLAPSTPLNRVKANIAAIEILRRLETEERPATAEEQKELARWSGWGATPQVFKPKPDEKFAPLQKKLQELLSEDEWREARGNTKNAHYTDPLIVQQVWDAVGDLGFDGGDVLEPGSGSGNFIGYAPEAARMMGVELDSITARISKALYPHADVRHESFGDTRAPNATFDLAIGNVPFGRYKVPDLIHNKGNHSIHNHFILKSLELTRPGGLVAMVTSSLTMDGHGQNAEAARMEMASKAELVGAIRLPSGAHQRTAGTGVVTDLLIFRRRERDKNFTSGRTRTKAIKAPSERGQNDPPMWVHSLPRFGLPGQLDPAVDKEAKPVHYNSYFHERPEQILGELSVGHGQNRADELRVDGSGGDPIKALRKALKRTVTEAKAAGLAYQAPPEGRKRVVLLPPGSPRVDGHVQAEPDGSFTQVRDGMVHPFPVPKTQADEARRLLAIRDTYQSLLAEESRRDADESLIERLRGALNEQYEAYAGQYGAINRFEWAKTTVTDPATGEKVQKAYRKKAPRGGLFSKDPTMSASVSSLDDYDDITKTTTRAAIFTKRQGTFREIAERADAPQDALAIVLEQHGNVTPAALADVMGTDEEDATARLLAAESIDPDTGISYPLVFQQPDGSLVPAADYLSGNVREKLAEARSAAVDDARFEVNVDHLERVIPPDLSTGEIAAPMGASWIGREPVQQFLRETLNSDKITVSWQGGALWAVDAPDGVKKQIAYATRDTWSGPGYDALKLAEAILTNRKIRVTVQVDEETVFDQKATDDAIARADQLKEAFTDWLWADPDRAERYKRLYNDQFNSMAPRSYDGQRRTMPGLVEWFNPHGHQHAAVSRMVNEPAVLLAHEVGAGKTAEMTMGVMELRRLGLIKKAAMVVPGHMLDQFTTEFAELYPESVANNRILAAGSDDLKGNGRREFIARAASGDYDAIIMTQTAFESIQMRHDVQERYIRRQLDALEEKIRRQKEIDGEDNDTRLVKRMENQLAVRREKLTKKLSGLKDAAGLHFEDMGIDYLVVDEAHMYKNLYTPSSIDSAAIEGSNRASDLEMKLEYLREHTGSGRVVTFATATPVANSITEVHTMMRYLRPDLLRQLGIEDFDDFASAFGQMVSAVERSPDGTYKEKTRLAAFQNVPELMRIWRAFADVKNSEDLDIPGIPEVAGGKAVTITMPMSEAQEEYEDEIKARAAKLAAGGVDPREDNYLKLMSDGRAAALDPRLLDMEMGPGNKLPTVADNIVRIHEQTKDVVYPSSKTNPTPHPTPGGLQIVFLDLGTPKDPSKAKKGKKKAGDAEAIEGADPAASTDEEQAATNFSTYDELKSLLIARGVPSEQIRFIHDAKDDAAKARLFHEARTGKISVLIGSTQKMGTGTNVQLRATALHHVDAPWRPADVEQRNGRVIRQGNANGEAAIFQYATERSTDAKFWEAIARKARFIRQLMRGSLTERVVEDIGEIKFDADESAALIAGDPHLIAQASLRPIVKRLRSRSNAHERSQEGFKKSIRDAELAEVSTAELIGELAETLKRRKRTRGADFNARIGATDFEGTEGRDKARDALNQALRGVLHRGRQGRIDDDQEPEVIGQLGGLDVTARYEQKWDFYTSSYTRGVHVAIPSIPGRENFYQDHHLVDMDDKPQPLPLMRLEDAVAGIEAQIRRAGDSLSDKRRAADQAKLRVGKAFDMAEDLAKSEQQLAILDQIMRLKAKSGGEPKEREAELRSLDQEFRELIGEEEDVLAQVSARELDLNPKTPAPPAVTTDEEGRTRYVWPDAEARKAAREKDRAEKREAEQARQRSRDEAAPAVPDALGMSEAELDAETERLNRLILNDEASEADVLRHAGLVREQTRRAKKKASTQPKADSPEANEPRGTSAGGSPSGAPGGADSSGSETPRSTPEGSTRREDGASSAPSPAPAEEEEAPAPQPENSTPAKPRAASGQERRAPAVKPYATIQEWREGLTHVDAAESRLGLAATAAWGHNDDDAPSAIPLIRRAVLDAVAAQEDDDYEGAEQRLADARGHAVGLLDTLEDDEREKVEGPLTDFLITLDAYLGRHRVTRAQWKSEDAERREGEAQGRAQTERESRAARENQRQSEGSPKGDQPSPAPEDSNGEAEPEAPARPTREEEAAEEYRRWAGVWADRPAGGPRNIYEDKVAADGPEGERATSPENIIRWIGVAASAAPLAQYDENTRHGLDQAPEEAREFLAGQASELRARVEELAREFRTESRRDLLGDITSREGKQKAQAKLIERESQHRDRFQQAVRDQIVKARAAANDHGLTDQQAEEFLVGVAGGGDRNQVSNGERGAFPEVMRSLHAAARDAAAYWSGFSGWATQDDSRSWDGLELYNSRRQIFGASPVPAADPETGTGALRIGEAELPEGLRWVRGTDLKAGDIYREAPPRPGSSDEFNGLEPPSYVIHTHASGTEGALRTVSLDGDYGGRAPVPGEYVVLLTNPDAKLRKRAQASARSDTYSLALDEQAYAEQAAMPKQPAGEAVAPESLTDGDAVRVRGTGGDGGVGQFEGYVEGTPERATMWRGGELVNGWKVRLRDRPEASAIWGARPYYLADGEENWAERIEAPSQSGSRALRTRGDAQEAPGRAPASQDATRSAPGGSRYGGELVTAEEVRNGDWVSVETTQRDGSAARLVGEVSEVDSRDGRVSFTVSSRDPQSKREGTFTEHADLLSGDRVERLPEGNPGRQDNSDLARRLKLLDEQERAAKIAVPEGWTAVDGERIEVRTGDRFRIATNSSRGTTYQDIEVGERADHQGDGFWGVAGDPNRRFHPRNIAAVPEGAEVRYVDAPERPGEPEDRPGGDTSSDGGDPSGTSQDEESSDDAEPKDGESSDGRRRRDRAADGPNQTGDGGRGGESSGGEESQGDREDDSEGEDDDDRRRRRRRDRDRNRPDGANGPRGTDRPHIPNGDNRDEGRNPAGSDQPSALDSLKGRYRSGEVSAPSGADPQQHAAYLEQLAANSTLALSPGGGLITWSDNGGRTWQVGHAASGLHLAGWGVTGDEIGGAAGARRLIGAYEELRDANGDPVNWADSEVDEAALRAWHTADGVPLGSAIAEIRQRMAEIQRGNTAKPASPRTGTTAEGTNDAPSGQTGAQSPNAPGAAGATGSAAGGQARTSPEPAPVPTPAGASQYAVNADSVQGQRRAGTVDGRRVPTPEEMLELTAGEDRVVTEEGEEALFGSPERRRELAAAGFVPMPVIRSDRAGEVWRDGRLIGSLFAPHHHVVTPSEQVEEVWWSEPPFHMNLAPHFSTREAAIAHLVLRDMERGEPDLSIVHPDLAWHIAHAERAMAFPDEKLRGLESLNDSPADMERYRELRAFVHRLGRGQTISGNVADDLAHLHDELRWLEATHYEHQPSNLKDRYILGPGWMAGKVQEYLDVLRPEDPRAKHHETRQDRAGKQFLDALLADGGQDRAQNIPVSEIRKGDIVHLEGRITGRYAGARGRKTGYVVGTPVQAKLTVEGKRRNAWRITVGLSPLGGMAIDTQTFLIPADESVPRLAAADEIDLPLDEHTYGRRAGAAPRPDAPRDRDQSNEEGSNSPAPKAEETRPAPDSSETGGQTGSAPAATQGSASRQTGTPQRENATNTPATTRATTSGAAKKKDPEAVPETESGATSSGPEPVGGRPAEWVKVSELGLGDLVRIEGITKGGTPRTLAGYVVAGPEKIPATQARRLQNMVRVLIADNPDGRGARQPVWVMPDAAAARATREDSDHVNGAPQTGADSDVRTGRIADRVPTDRNGNGLFPGSIVTDNDGREGVIKGASAGTVRVQFGDDRTDDDASPTSLNVIDGGAARPSGWTTDGHRVRPGAIAGDRDGNVLGTVEDVDGDLASVATPSGMRDVPIGELRVLEVAAEETPSQDKAHRLERVPVGDLAEGDVLLVDNGATGMSAAYVIGVEEVRPGHIRITAADAVTGEERTLDGTTSSVYTRILGADGQAPELNENDAPASRGQLTTHEPAPAVEPVTGATVEPQLSPEERDAIVNRGSAPAGDPDAQQAVARIANDLPITPAQASALAKDLRENTDVSTAEGRAALRAANSLEAAVAGEPDTTGRPEPGTVGSVGVGDTIALPSDFDPDTLAAYKVVAIEEGPGGVRALTIEDRDGRRSKRTFGSGEALHQLPAPQVPAGANEEAEPRDPNPAPDADRLRSDYADSVARAVIDNAVQGTTTPGSIHQLREQIAAQLTPESLQTAMRQARDRALSEITDAGIDGEERKELVRSLRAKAATARRDTIRAAVRTLNDLEPLEGESEEDLAHRAADLLRLIPDALRNQSGPDTAEGDARTDDAVTRYADDAVGEALQSAAGGGLTDERRAAIVQQLADRMAANRDATAQSIASALPAGRRPGILPHIVAALITLARKIVAIVAAFLKAMAAAWRKGREALGRLRGRVAHFRRGLMQRLKSWPEARRMRRLAAATRLTGHVDGLPLGDRVAHWTRLMPAPGRFGQVSRRARWYLPASRATLSSGQLPQVQDGVRWLPDRAADGGPGLQALRHLAAVRAAGLDVDIDVAARLSVAAPELGDDPHGTVRHASSYADNAEQRLRDLQAAAAGGAPDVELDIDAAQVEAQSARQEARRLQQAYAAALPDIVLGVLAEVRDMGPAGASLITTPDSDPEATRALVDVSRFVPTDWLAPTESRFIAARSGEAGGYDGRTATIADLGDAGRRAAAHALLAHLQRNYPDIAAAQEAFHFTRTHRGRAGARRRTALEIRLGRLFGDRSTQGTPDDIVPLGLADLFSGDWYADDDLRAFLLGLLATR
ncbi:SNF2-related protein [Streptomyces parvus]|uniref:helicase-related protein n=1 Tax=Streptomyces parvus TaxID=66428 RepID=UPI0033F8C4E3